MNTLKQRVIRELRALCVVMVYFAIWVASLILLKHLLLAQYDITVYGWSAAIVGVLVLSKVVLLLERVPLGSWVLRQQAWVDVILRTALYSFAVFIVLMLERGIKGAHEHGGFAEAVVAAVAETDEHHLLANALCITWAFLVYNALAVVRARLGAGGIRHAFFKPLPEGTD